MRPRALWVGAEPMLFHAEVVRRNGKRADDGAAARRTHTVESSALGPEYR